MSAKGQHKHDGDGLGGHDGDGHNDDGQCLDGYETPEVAHYIHGMLESLEAIAGNCDMHGVADLLAKARAETAKHF